MEITKMKFADVYPLYVAKAERKGKSKLDVDTIICWLTGYTVVQIEEKVIEGVDLELFFASAPMLNPNREHIAGSICGIKINSIEDPTTKEIRRLDKLIDELAKGKAMDKILR